MSVMCVKINAQREMHEEKDSIDVFLWHGWLLWIECRCILLDLIFNVQVEL